MPKRYKNEHRPYVDRITDAAQVEATARARAQAQVAAAILYNRNATNAAIVEAVSRGVPKTIIAEALDVSYTTIMNRVGEHHARIDYTKPTDPAVDPVPNPSITVRSDGAGHMVTLSHFTHPDVGTDLNGQVMFDEDGELKIADSAFNEHQAGDPLWGDKLWATTEVQRAVAGA